MHNSNLLNEMKNDFNPLRICLYYNLMADEGPYIYIEKESGSTCTICEVIDDPPTSSERAITCRKHMNPEEYFQAIQKLEKDRSCEVQMYWDDKLTEECDILKISMLKEGILIGHNDGPLTIDDLLGKRAKNPGIYYAPSKMYQDMERSC